MLKGRDPLGKRRADYLFSNRSIIVEQKVLETDPIEKQRRYLDRLRSENRIIGWGIFALNKDAFYKLQDGEKLFKALLDKTTSGIEGIASLADKQPEIPTRYSASRCGGDFDHPQRGGAEPDPGVARIKDPGSIQDRQPGRIGAVPAQRYDHGDLGASSGSHWSHNISADEEVHQFDRAATGEGDSLFGQADCQLAAFNGMPSIRETDLGSSAMLHPSS